MCVISNPLKERQLARASLELLDLLRERERLEKSIAFHVRLVNTLVPFFPQESDVVNKAKQATTLAERTPK